MSTRHTWEEGDVYRVLMSARGLPVSSASRELVVVRVHAGAVSEPDLSFSAPRSTIDKEEQRQAETILLPYDIRSTRRSGAPLER